MIKELSEFGEPICEKKYGRWNHVALKEEFISIDIVIDKDGSFIKFVPFDKTPTIAETLTSKKGSARLLLDKAEEVLCYGGDQSRGKHDLFMRKLHRYRNVAELRPVVAFYENNRVNGVEKASKDFESAIPEKKRTGNLGFRIQTEAIRIHEKDKVRTRIIVEYEQDKKSVPRKKCSVCEKSDYPVEDEPHGMVKNVPNGRSSGCALVSYNAPAFESYRLKGNDNASICASCARRYVEGLNTLLADGVPFKNEKKKEDMLYAHRWPRKRSKSYSVDIAIVFWTRDNQSLPEIDQLEAPSADDVAKMIESLTAGKANDGKYLETDRFYSCTLSGAAARIAVRDWIETSLVDFKQAIALWFRDIAIMQYEMNQKKLVLHYAPLYDLARSCQRKNSDNSHDKDDTATARVASVLWKAALQNAKAPLPDWILAKVLQRARLDKNGVTAERAALIKLILNRNEKGGGFVITESKALGERPVAYICGQIFAAMESIQYWSASGERNAGIRERYFTFSMTRPKAAFGILFDLSSKHLRKLKNEKPGHAVNLDKELQYLVKDIDIHQLPSTFTLEQKGQFAIGYYHQRQEQFANSKSKKGGGND